MTFVVENVFPGRLLVEKRTAFCSFFLVASQTTLVFMAAMSNMFPKTAKDHLGEGGRVEYRTYVPFHQNNQHRLFAVKRYHMRFLFGRDFVNIWG